MQEHLDKSGLQIAGTRTIAEIARHLTDIAADAGAKPLPKAAADLLDGYLGIRCPARSATGEIRARLKGYGLMLDASLAAFDARLDLVAAEGVDLAAAEFGAGSAVPSILLGLRLRGAAATIGGEARVGGGGRYDGLVRAAGATREVPAVGAAIHTERLLLAVRGGQP